MTLARALKDGVSPMALRVGIQWYPLKPKTDGDIAMSSQAQRDLAKECSRG